MNALITNKQDGTLAKLGLEIIKTLRGEFSADDIIGAFANNYYNRYIIDITAIKDYQDIANIQKITLALPVDKIILLIPPRSNEATPAYLSKLISVGLYNFTSSIEGVTYLYDHPNSYKDVAHLHNLSGTASSNKPVNMVVPKKMEVEEEIPQRIIGFKNITDAAGATSLVVRLKKEIETFYNKSVKAIEVNKRDFIYIPDKNLVSKNSFNIKEEIDASSTYDVILIDLNDASPDICDDVFYLIEPSNIKMNKLKFKDDNFLLSFRDKKIILNKCLLENMEIAAFENENGIKVYNAIRPFSDKSDKSVFAGLLKRLNIIRE